jgi:benzoyl-CoA reductase subunit A
MKVYVGIDLGSTTTKSVVLDEHGRIFGRGITNSRSNYDVACEIARGEALADARFKIFGELLSRDLELAARRDEFLELLRHNFRLEQYLHSLGELEARSLVCAEPFETSLRALFGQMRAEAPALYAPGAKARSDFFRDLAGSRFAQLARRQASEHGVDFELLVSIYDKSILGVENTAATAAFQELLEAAVRRCLSAAASTRMARELEAACREALEMHLVEAISVGTGYGRARLPFPKERIRSEILCHGLGAHAAFPDTRTVLDIGGQDTKAIQVDEHGVVTSFQMNDRCAAGCGRYLGYIAEEMNIGLHELGPIALKSKKPVRVSSTCTVFAGAELRDRLAGGHKREDILDGLHRAIMLRAMSLLARSGGVHEQFTFTGGVAKNPAAVRALRGLVRESYGERTLNISADSIFTGALGAAIFALREERPGAEAAPVLVGGAACS